MKKNLIWKVVIIVILVFLFGNGISFALGGMNIYTMIYDLFKGTPEEPTNIELEGNKENVNMVKINSQLGYSIQYDKDYFTFSGDNEKDYYRATAEGMEDKIYFMIEHGNATYDDMKNEEKFKEAEEFNINGRRAFRIEFMDGKLMDDGDEQNWYTQVKALCFIEANKGVFCVEEHYFLEATEGYGVRMEQIINTIKLNEEQ